MVHLYMWKDVSLCVGGMGISLKVKDLLRVVLLECRYFNMKIIVLYGQ